MANINEKSIDVRNMSTEDWSECINKHIKVQVCDGREYDGYVDNMDGENVHLLLPIETGQEETTSERAYGYGGGYGGYPGHGYGGGYGGYPGQGGYGYGGHQGYHGHGGYHGGYGGYPGQGGHGYGGYHGGYPGQGGYPGYPGYGGYGYGGQGGHYGRLALPLAALTALSVL